MEDNEFYDLLDAADARREMEDERWIEERRRELSGG